MSSSTSSTQEANTSECQWNYDHEVKSDLTVKANVRTRRKREFTPNELKDENYWMKRSRNNEAAKRSRERRRMEERLLEEQALHLLRENEKLKAALSAIHYPGVGKETSYDTSVDYTPVRESSQDSYVRTQVDFPAANRAPHYALPGRGSAYDAVPIPRTQSFSAASFPSVDNKHQRDRYLELNALSNGNVPCCSLPYENAQRKWGQSHEHSMMNFQSNSARFSLNKMMRGNQYPAGSSSNYAAHTRTSESHVEQRSSATEPETKCDQTAEKEPERVVTSPLLPHKLRYKINKARHGKERVDSTAGISRNLQE
ncbi:Nuclear factor interleukin-3-regulated protein [Bagarius yarrelli]|uniref:Nuclear factor interleukin-3-regulated protein n=1 Tax=Bagarius yarrelli TaxID=175774 RepID=A0A556V2B1_BAGYA|nr:Nuclear factor interleukin-3-regulated protein [Bagarius yarrelli]